MKKNRLIAFTMAVVCMVLLVIPAFAAEARASVQLASYFMNATISSGTITVEFTVTGTGTMNKLGCESIAIYEQSGSRWVLVKTFDEDDTGMSKTSSVMYANTIKYNTGKAEASYKVVVTIFAENSAGRDARARDFYI